MKAAEYRSFGPPQGVHVIDRPAPPPPGPGQLRIRVRAAALNPKDILLRKGKFRWFSGRHFPRGMGFDFAGTVIDGEGQEPGTRVFGMINGWLGRTFAEQLLCDRDECHPMPEGIEFTQAAALPLVGQTALQALRDEGELRAGRSVLINGGSGGVGTVAIQLARALGARVSVTCSERNADLCRELGAERVIDYRHDDALAGADRYDLIFDAFGNRSFSEARGALTPRGRYVSTVPGPRIFFDRALSLPAPRKARLVVVRSRREDLATLAAWVAAGTLRPVIDRILPLEEIVAAQQHLETRRARGKIVLTIE